jgi:predicted phosphodiesterase
VKYGVLGDVHGNLQALEAVLAELEKESVDGILCVGDLVGYGADPRGCVDRMRETKAVVVAGNHDWGSIGKTSIEFFNADAKESILWTRESLTDGETAYLTELPLVAEMQDVTLVHGTLYFPENFDYIQTLYDAHLSFSSLKTRVCFLGHSHIPIVFFNDDPISYFLEPEIDLSLSSKTIVNVGSVGQPRDQDPRASYAIYDSEAGMVYLRRVDYDIKGAQDAIEEAGLPATNSHRLMFGR